jgi:glycosyltransferase involved in cell wall biosynthesis
VAFGNAAVLRGMTPALAGADIIHLHLPFYGSACWPVFYRHFINRQSRLVVHYHMDTRAGGWKGFIFYSYRLLVLPWLVRTADAVTCASVDYVKHSDIARYYAQEPAKFSQVPFGVDTERFQPGANSKKQILFVGGLDKPHYFKGLHVLFATLANLGEQLEDYNLLVVGSGELLANYQAEAQRLGIGERVVFADKVDDAQLAEHYRQSAFLVLPSINRGEAFGLVLLEAMASGLPVLASNLPGVRSVFKNNEQGYLVKPGDADDLAKKILTLIRQPAKRQAMGQSARALVEATYSWEKAGEKLNELYYKVRAVPSKGQQNRH